MFSVVFTDVDRRINYKYNKPGNSAACILPLIHHHVILLVFLIMIVNLLEPVETSF